MINIIGSVGMKHNSTACTQESCSLCNYAVHSINYSHSLGFANSLALGDVAVISKV